MQRLFNMLIQNLSNIGSITEVCMQSNILLLDFTDKDGNKYSFTVMKKEEKKDA